MIYTATAYSRCMLHFSLSYLISIVINNRSNQQNQNKEIINQLVFNSKWAFSSLFTNARFNSSCVSGSAPSSPMEIEKFDKCNRYVIQPRKEQQKKSLKQCHCLVYDWKWFSIRFFCLSDSDWVLEIQWPFGRVLCTDEKKRTLKFRFNILYHDFSPLFQQSNMDEKQFTKNIWFDPIFFFWLANN